MAIFMSHADDEVRGGQSHYESNPLDDMSKMPDIYVENANDLEKTMTGQSGRSEMTRTATGQAHIGENEDPRIDAKTFMAVLAISFLWTGSQVPLYMLLIANDYTLADIGGATVSVWFILGAVTALAAIAPLAGSIADLFGRRWTILIGGLSLILGLLVYGTATGPTALLVSLPFSGGGAALLEINALAAVNEIVPNKLRGFYTSMLIWALVPFVPLGIYALNLAAYASWRWCIWLSLIWVGIGQITTFFFYRPPPRVFLGKQLTMQERFARVDWVGVALSIAGVTLFMFGLGCGGNTAPWSSAITIAPLVIGFCLLVTLGFWQTKAENPMFPPAMFKNFRVLILTQIITFCAGANFFTVIILWPKFVLAVYSLSPTRAGALCMAQTAGTMFGAGFFSWTITKFKGSIRPQMVLGCAMMAIGLGALKVVNESRPVLGGVLITIGAIGIGSIIIPASVITQLCSPDEYLGTITAFTFMARSIGGAVGFTVMQHVLKADMAAIFASKTNKSVYNIAGLLITSGVPKEEIGVFLGALAINDIKALLSMPNVTHKLVDEVVVLSQPLWAQGYGNVWLVSVAFSVVGLICAAFLGDVSKYMTNHRAVHM